MSVYRFTFFRDGLIVGATDLECDDADAEALAASHALSLGGPVEIDEVPLVAKVEGGSESS